MERASDKVKCGTTLKILVPTEKVFSVLRASELLRVDHLIFLVWYLILVIRQKLS